MDSLWSERTPLASLPLADLALRLVEWVGSCRGLEEFYRFCPVRFVAHWKRGNDLIDLPLDFLHSGLALLRRSRPHHRPISDRILLSELPRLTKSRLQRVGRKQLRVAPCFF